MHASFNHLFSFSLKNKERIISLFKFFFFLQISFGVLATWFILTQKSTYTFFYQLGINNGRLALIFYILTTLPGITRRFGIKNKLIGILLIFRRYLGIAMFLFVLNHFWLVRGLNSIAQGNFSLSRPLFEVVGTMAFLLTLPLFLTANDKAVRLLGDWWQRIHNLTYIIVFLIFLHVALQRFSLWSLLIGITAFLQLASHIYRLVKKKYQ